MSKTTQERSTFVAPKSVIMRALGMDAGHRGAVEAIDGDDAGDATGDGVEHAA